MSDWMRSKVEDLFTMGRGRVISGTEITNNSGSYPVFSSQTSNNGCMGFIGSYDFEGELITWTTDGANAGTVFYRKGKFNCTNVCGTLRAKDHKALDHRFFASLLSTLTKRHVSYIGNPKLMNGTMGKIDVLYPSFNEQRKIAQILDTLDTVIRETEAIIEKLKQLQQGLMHDLLTRGIDANGELRPPQSQAPHLYKDSPLGWIPKEWETETLSQRLMRITYGFTNPMPTTEDGPWMLTAADINNGRVLYEKARHTAERNFHLLSAKSRPRIGDVLVTKDGTLGRVAVLDRDNVCINQSAAVLSPLEKADGIYLSTYLQSPLGQDRMLADSGGSTIKHLYITKLAKMEIPWPLPDESHDNALRISAMEERISNECNKLAKLQQQKSGLMDDLLTGRVRVTSLLKGNQ
jgi:type I restriction enzyme, S subunit